MKRPWGGVLGWWSLFNSPRDVLPQALALFARALKPGGHFITATHVGDEDAAVRTEAYGGVPVRGPDSSVRGRSARPGPSGCCGQCSGEQRYGAGSGRRTGSRAGAAVAFAADYAERLDAAR